MQERQDALVRYYSSNELENNWRSRKNVVEFNNGVFELMQHHLSDEHSSIYDHLVQGVKGEDGGYVTPIECVGEYATYISRLRDDITVENGISVWCVSDNLRKGAALNAVQIAELLGRRCLKKGEMAEAS